MQQSEFEGRWKKPGHIALGDLVWIDPGKSGLRTDTATVAGKPVATIHTQLFKRGFAGKVPGWLYPQRQSPLALHRRTEIAASEARYVHHGGRKSA